LMYLLGISCFFHDAAACLLKDGLVVAASQEERFSRVKHDWRLPVQAIDSCLASEGITINDVEAIAYHEKPFLKFERILENFLVTVPRGMRSFVDIMPTWLSRKLWVPSALKKELGYDGPVLYGDHHLSHAASSYFPSPFEEAAILTVDGVGEWATATWGVGRGNRLELSQELHFPHSLGLLYSAFTAFLGFEVNEGEYKVMGMASYGLPVYAELIRDNLLAIMPDGSFRLNMDYFSFQYGQRMVNSRFERLLGMPARQPESALTGRHYDVAASIQVVTEELLLAMTTHVYRETGLSKLCLAGGVALNCVANSRILHEGPFEEVFIQPAAGDAGAALGAALLAWHDHFGKTDRMVLEHVYWGPEFTKSVIESSLRKHADELCWNELGEADLVAATARHLAEGRVVGWFQGKMEFGPRALGNRSILADPRSPGMKERVNDSVKFREPFRPFAPAVPVENAANFFDMTRESPFMLFTAPVISEMIPAVTHVDRTARVQTVSRKQNRMFYDLLVEFGYQTGIPVLMNTSFNLKGEPIVCTPADAVDTFRRCDMDLLVIGSFMATKKGKLWVE
jgi:carbamoyltransferase